MGRPTPGNYDDVFMSKMKRAVCSALAKNRPPHRLGRHVAAPSLDSLSTGLSTDEAVDPAFDFELFVDAFDEKDVFIGELIDVLVKEIVCRRHNAAFATPSPTTVQSLRHRDGKMTTSTELALRELLSHTRVISNPTSRLRSRTSHVRGPISAHTHSYPRLRDYTAAPDLYDTIRQPLYEAYRADDIDALLFDPNDSSSDSEDRERSGSGVGGRVGRNSATEGDWGTLLTESPAAMTLSPASPLPPLPSLPPIRLVAPERPSSGGDAPAPSSAESDPRGNQILLSEQIQQHDALEPLERASVVNDSLRRRIDRIRALHRAQASLTSSSYRRTPLPASPYPVTPSASNSSSLTRADDFTRFSSLRRSLARDRERAIQVFDDLDREREPQHRARQYTNSLHPLPYPSLTSGAASRLRFGYPPGHPLSSHHTPTTRIPVSMSIPESWEDEIVDQLRENGRFLDEMQSELESDPLMHRLAEGAVSGQAPTAGHSTTEARHPIFPLLRRQGSANLRSLAQSAGDGGSGSGRNTNPNAVPRSPPISPRRRRSSSANMAMGPPHSAILLSGSEYDDESFMMDIAINRATRGEDAGASGSGST